MISEKILQEKNRVAQEISALEESTGEKVVILDALKKISEQINLLALEIVIESLSSATTDEVNDFENNLKKLRDHIDTIQARLTLTDMTELENILKSFELETSESESGNEKDADKKEQKLKADVGDVEEDDDEEEDEETEEDIEDRDEEVVGKVEIQPVITAASGSLADSKKIQITASYSVYSALFLEAIKKLESAKAYLAETHTDNDKKEYFQKPEVSRAFALVDLLKKYRDEFPSFVEAGGIHAVEQFKLYRETIDQVDKLKNNVENQYRIDFTNDQSEFLEFLEEKLLELKVRNLRQLMDSLEPLKQGRGKSKEMPSQTVNESLTVAQRDLNRYLRQPTAENKEILSESIDQAIQNLQRKHDVRAEKGHIVESVDQQNLKAININLDKLKKIQYELEIAPLTELVIEPIELKKIPSFKWSAYWEAYQDPTGVLGANPAPIQRHFYACQQLGLDLKQSDINALIEKIDRDPDTESAEYKKSFEDTFYKSYLNNIFDYLYNKYGNDEDLYVIADQVFENKKMFLKNVNSLEGVNKVLDVLLYDENYRLFVFYDVSFKEKESVFQVFKSFVSSMENNESTVDEQSLEQTKQKLAKIEQKSKEYRYILDIKKVQGLHGTNSSVSTKKVNDGLNSVKHTLLIYQRDSNENNRKKALEAIKNAVELLAEKVDKDDKKVKLNAEDRNELEQIAENINIFLYFNKLLNGNELHLDSRLLQVQLMALEKRDVLLEAATKKPRLVTIDELKRKEAEKLQKAYDKKQEKGDVPNDSYHVKNYVFSKDDLDPSVLGTNEQFELRKYKDDAYNIIRIENIRDRIELYANVALMLDDTKKAQIDAIKAKYLNAAEAYCLIKVELFTNARGKQEGDPDFDKAAEYFDKINKIVKRLYSAMQVELIEEVQDKLKENESPEKAFKASIGEYITRHARPNALHQYENGTFNANTTNGVLTIPSIKRNEIGIIPNFVTDTVGHLSSEKKIEIDAFHLRSASLPAVGHKDEVKRKESFDIHANVLVKESALKAIEAGNVQPGETIKLKIHATTLLTPWGQYKEKLVKMVLDLISKYEDETEQLLGTHNALMKLDGRELRGEELDNLNDKLRGRKIQVEIVHVNVPVSLRSTPAKAIEFLTGVSVIGRLIEVVAKPLRFVGDNINTYRLSSTHQDTILKEGFSRYCLDQAESLRSKFTQDEYKAYREILATTWNDNDENWQRLSKDAIIKLQNPILPKDERKALTQFLYYARVQEMYFTEEYQRNEVSSYFFSTMMDRSQEMADFIVWDACKSGKDRTGKISIFKQAFV
ncbi:MAG: hypothetical protein AB7F64_08025, partial [Gammaproteobacteria bacterium]